MSRVFLAALVAGFVMTLVPLDADAKRLGGARSSGMQRQAPDKPVQKAPAQDQAGQASAAPGAAAGPAAAAKAAPAAAAPRRNWTGPLMGLAAGLGLAALFSHLGMGEGFASVMMLLLLGLVGFAVVRFFMARRRVATAGGPAVEMPEAAFNRSAAPVGGGADLGATGSGVRIGTALNAPLAVPGLNDGANDANARYLPADFDATAFERVARTIFIRLQAANDERNLNELRAFTTPEMFAELQADIMERGSAAQHTEVMSVNPTIVDFAEEDDRQIVSVRYVGVVRESEDAASTPIDEVWHLVKADDSPAWRIAGIQQRD